MGFLINTKTIISTTIVIILGLSRKIKTLNPRKVSFLTRLPLSMVRFQGTIIGFGVSRVQSTETHKER